MQSIKCENIQISTYCMDFAVQHIIIKIFEKQIDLLSLVRV